MTLPAIDSLKQHLPQAKIFIAAKKYLCGIYENLPTVDGFIPLPNKIDAGNLFSTAKHLKKLHFDAGILLTNSFSSAALFKLAHIKPLIGYKKDYRAFLLTVKLPFSDNQNHHIHFYLDLVNAFLTHVDPLLKPHLQQQKITDYSHLLTILDDERITVTQKLASLGIQMQPPLIGIAPSAAYGSAKQWLPQRFKELISRLKEHDPSLEILLFGSQKERQNVSQLAGGETAGVHNLAGRLSLRESLVAISLCRGFVSNDSGLMHIASSLDVPLVALFGPTQPGKTAPLHQWVETIHYPQPCWPCLHRQCPLDGHPCMSAISVDEVFEKTIAMVYKE